MKTKPKQFAKTKFALAKQCGVSRNTLDNFLSMPGAPEPGKDGWDALTVAEWISANATNARTLTAVSPAVRDLKAYQLQLLCARLRFNIERERGEWVKQSDVLGSIQALAVRVRTSLSNKLEREWPSQVAGANDIPAARSLGAKLFDEIMFEFQALSDCWKVRNGNEISPLPNDPGNKQL